MTNKNIKGLEIELKEVKLEIARLLKKLRISRGFTSPFQVSQETGSGADAIYKIEKGGYIPSRRTLLMLFSTYKMTTQEFEVIQGLLLKGNELKKEIKRLQNECL